MGCNESKPFPPPTTTTPPTAAVQTPIQRKEQEVRVAPPPSKSIQSNSNERDTSGGLSFRVGLWNAFADGTVARFKSKDDEVSTKIIQSIQSISKMNDIFSNEIYEIRRSISLFEESNTYTATLVENESSYDDNFVSIVALCLPNLETIKLQQMHVNNVLEKNVLKTWNEMHENYLAAIVSLEERYTTLCSTLALHDKDCWNVQLQYQSACDNVNRVIEKRNSEANNVSLEGREKLKVEIVLAIKHMIESENKYKKAIETFHGFQKEMQDETNVLLDEFQKLKVEQVKCTKS